MDKKNLNYCCEKNKKKTICVRQCFGELTLQTSNSLNTTHHSDQVHSRTRGVCQYFFLGSRLPVGVHSEV